MNRIYTSLKTFITSIPTVINTLSRAAWQTVGLILIAATLILLTSHPFNRAPHGTRPSWITIQKPIPWNEVDQAVVAALRSAETNAETFVRMRLDAWTTSLQQRVDQNFLPWYFDYWTQQGIGLRALAYKIAEYVGQRRAEDRITEEIEQEFSNRVLRPQTAQLEIERISQDTVQVFITSLQRNLQEIPQRYCIPQIEWERYLEDLALLTTSVEGNRRVSLGLKTIMAAGAAGATVATLKITQMLRPAIGRIGTSTAARGAGTAAVGVASETGARMTAMACGEFLGLIVGAGILVWDVWDHHQTRQTQEPVLRASLADYLSQMRRRLQDDIMNVIRELEAGCIGQMKHR